MAVNGMIDLCQVGASGSSSGPSPAFTIVAKTANYTLAATETYAKGSGSAFTFTLPTSPTTGLPYWVHKTDAAFANIITVAGAGGFTTTLNTQDEKVACVYDGAAWLLLERVIPSVWTTYTPNDGASHQVGAVTTAPGLGSGFALVAKYRRVKDAIELAWEYQQTAGGSAGSGNYLFPLPTGLAANSSIVNTAPTGGQQTLGTALYTSSSNGSNWVAGTVQMNGASAVSLQLGNGLASSAAGTFFQATTLRFSFECRIPISGWSG